MPDSEDILNERNKIDEVDMQILKLLNKRAEISLNIRQIKKIAGDSLYNPKREEDIINNLCLENNGPLYDENVREIFTNILRIVRGLPDAE